MEYYSVSIIKATESGAVNVLSGRFNTLEEVASKLPSGKPKVVAVKKVAPAKKAPAKKKKAAPKKVAPKTKARGPKGRFTAKKVAPKTKKK